MPQFIQKWVEDKARGQITQEVGVIESEWPAHTGSATASGYYFYSGAVSESAVLLLSVPSSRWFKPRMLWINNMHNLANELTFYEMGSAASCSATIQGLRMLPQTTEFIAMDGITIGGDMWMSGLLDSIAVRVTGILVNSGPEN